MAHPERNMGSGGRPDPFEAMMSNAFGEGDGGLFEAKQRGYIGPMGEQAFKWRQGGMGQEVGMQTYSATGRNTTDQNNGHNQMLFYALRLPESITQGRRMRLAVVLTEYHYDVAVIQARESANGLVNETMAYHVDFDDIFKPQDNPDSQPAIVPAIIDHPFQGKIRTFQDNIDQWPFKRAKNVNVQSDILLEVAVKYEEELRLQRAQAGIEDVLGSELIGLLDTSALATNDAPGTKTETQQYDVFDMESMFGFEVADLDFEGLARQMDKRFPGPMGDEIEEMDKQGGLVRIISALQPGGNRVMSAAIRLDDTEDGDPRHALVFTKVNLEDPDNLEESFDVRIVRPKKAGPYTQGEKLAEIESSRIDYLMMLTASDLQSPQPYVAERWETTSTEPPLQSFDINLEHLPLVLDKSDRRTAVQIKKDVLNRVLTEKMVRDFSRGDVWNDFGQPGTEPS